MNNQYRAKIKKFNNGKIKIREYQDLMTIPKNDKSYISDSKETEEIKDLKKENNRNKKRNKKRNGKITNRSLSKTRNTLFELIDNNENKFISFITLTFKDEIEDISEAYKYLRSYIKSVKRNMKDLYYIAIPEIQHKRQEKTGKSVIHFHLITNIPLGTDLIPEKEPFTFYSKSKKRYITVKYYDLMYWTKGFSSALPIKYNGNFELSKYLIKYLYKEKDDKFYGRQKLLHSNNLKTPDFEYVMNPEQIKKENENNINEVFSMLENEVENPFTDYIYKKNKH